jgi:hypothetical protein
MGLPVVGGGVTTGGVTTTGGVGVTGAGGVIGVPVMTIGVCVVVVTMPMESIVSSCTLRLW